MEDTSEERSRKRVKLNNEELDAKGLPPTFTSSISPPPLRRDRISEQEKVNVIKSPFQLTWIRDLPEASNKDALSLKDLLGDPLISECWEFNYLHDLEFLMAAFDPDVRDLIKVHVIHGFWKKEDQSRINLQV
jgi:tyrosyl-DNA phosphodiesterase-1